MYKLLYQSHITNLMNTLDVNEFLEAVNDSLKYLQASGDNEISARIVKYFVMTNSFVKNLTIIDQQTEKKTDLNLICQLSMRIGSVLTQNKESFLAYKVLKRNGLKIKNQS